MSSMTTPRNIKNRQDLQDFSGFCEWSRILRNPVNPVYFRRSLMKKTRARRPANTAERPAKINRRSFVKLLPAAGLSGAAMANLDAPPGAAIANAQEAQRQTPQNVTKETLRAAEQLIGIELTDAQEATALPGANRNLASYEALRKI